MAEQRERDGPGPGGFVRAGEGRALVLGSLAFFCLLPAYYVIRPVRDQLAGATGSVALPLFYSGTFVAMLAIAPLFGWLTSRLPRRAARNRPARPR